MPTLIEVKNKIDARLLGLWPIIVLKQDAYFSSHGRYWQGTLTPINSVTDAIDTDIDATLKPTDQLETWADMIGAQLPAQLPMQIQIDVYESSAGHGFTVTVLSKFINRVHVRSMGVGVENRDVSWRVKD